jgi:arylsulfatase
MTLKILTKWAAPLIVALVALSAEAADKKPNIVFIMGDDVGMWNIGAYHRGMMAAKTPNLDKLAKEGMMFTDYYADNRRILGSFFSAISVCSC